METSYVNKITGFVIALVLGAIMIGGVLAPTVAGIQVSVGNDATITNTMSVDNPKYTIWDGSDIEFIFDEDTNTYTIDGVEYDFFSTTQHIIIASNDFACRNGGNIDSPQLQTQYVDETTQVFNISFSYTITNREYTLILNETTYTGTVEWLVYASTDGSANLGQLPTNGAFCTSSTNELIVLGNMYTTGDNDTFYSYYNGALTVNEAYEDVSNVVISKTLKSGYTDIYDTTVTVNVGDESFVPFFILAPVTVTGHEAGGPAYVMFGVLTLLAIVMLVVIAANAVRGKYN